MNDGTLASSEDENEENEGAEVDYTKINSIDTKETDEEDTTLGRKKKSYERGAFESTFQEDSEYLKFRNRKIGQMDRVGRHLLIYSNINQLNFVNINNEDTAKAWIILFHFQNKSLQSMLYDEFNSISLRNTIGKCKNHNLFS